MIEQSGFVEVRVFLGEKSARRLVEEFGGTSIYIPMKETPVAQRLAQVLGEDVAERLIGHFQGDHIEIPLNHKSRLSLNLNECLRRFQAGESVTVIAREMGTCQRTVRRWCRRLGISKEETRAASIRCQRDGAAFIKDGETA